MDSAFIRGLINEVGIRVRTARVRARLTQKELGELIGYSTSGVAKVERGKSEPRLTALAQIAAVTGVPFVLLLPIAFPQQFEKAHEFTEHMRRASEFALAEWLTMDAEDQSAAFLDFTDPSKGWDMYERLPRRVRHRRKPK